MRIVGLKKLKAKTIEEIAYKEIENFDQRILEKPNPSCVLNYSAKLIAQGELQLQFLNLGYKGGGKVLGLFLPMTSVIVIEKKIHNELRMNFVLAHEIGHYLLHRNVKLPKGLGRNGMVDTKFDLNGKKILESDLDFMEWQANHFASCFLMPKGTFLVAFKNVCEERAVELTNGKLVLSNNRFTWHDLHVVKSELSKIFQVSKLSIEYRMRNLEIIINQSDCWDSNEYYKVNGSYY